MESIRPFCFFRGSSSFFFSQNPLGFKLDTLSFLARYQFHKHGVHRIIIAIPNHSGLILDDFGSVSADFFFSRLQRMRSEKLGIYTNSIQVVYIYCILPLG